MNRAGFRLVLASLVVGLFEGLARRRDGRLRGGLARSLPRGTAAEVENA